MMGASDVFSSCAGWLMVSASRTTSWRDLASSKILSISLWTSAVNEPEKDREVSHLTEQPHSLNQRKQRRLFLAAIHLYLAQKHQRATFCSLTQAGARVGSLHYGLLVQHRALRQRQISSHPCNRDPTEEASYHITSTNRSISKEEMNLYSLETKNKSSSSCVLSTMKRDSTNSSAARSQRCCTLNGSCREPYPPAVKSVL